MNPWKQQRYYAELQLKFSGVRMHTLLDLR